MPVLGAVGFFLILYAIVTHFSGQKSEVGNLGDIRTCEALHDESGIGFGTRYRGEAMTLWSG